VTKIQTINAKTPAAISLFNVILSPLSKTTKKTPVGIEIRKDAIANGMAKNARIGAKTQLIAFDFLNNLIFLSIK